jgi:dipeptidyl-peptidase-3
LIEFYKTGDLKTFNEYSFKWVKDTESRVDFLNGFIETYSEPLDFKGDWEALVNFKNLEATKRMQKISDHAQWFEDNSPTDSRFKKSSVVGVSAKAITVAYLGGDLYPNSCRGINLPNLNWIREVYGSKSVSLSNIIDTIALADQYSNFNDEFYPNQESIDRAKRDGLLSLILKIDLHECIGHASGELLPNVTQTALGVYGSTIEEARADCFGLYYVADPKLVSLGLQPDSEAYKAEYDRFLLDGLLTQLTSVKLGDQIEEDHMRDRALISH